jgi:TRAP-type C4-dicarboxylate transport system permease small subunit
MCLLTLLAYAAGTSQGFMDSTQLALLRLSAALGIFLAVSSIFGIALDLLRFFMYRNARYLLRAGIYLLLVLFGVITLLVAMSIITLSNGNGG